MANKIPSMLFAQANLHSFTQCLTQFGVSTGQRPSPEGDVNAATLVFAPCEGAEICATPAGLSYFTL